MTSIRLPAGPGETENYRLRAPGEWRPPVQALRSRILFAAAHVVGRAGGDNAPGAPADLDWDQTLDFRAYLGSWGLGVAEAMDTAQRGMGLDWAATRELVERSAAAARSGGWPLVAGAGTDHVPAVLESLDDVTRAYEEQLAVIHNAGAAAVLLASRQLARLAAGPEDYARVYDTVLAQTDHPVILHWLGPTFDPALAGYWGADDLDEAAASLVTIIHEHVSVVDGVKVSLLDAEREVRLRAALPAGVRLYTGDDFNYPYLIRGDQHGHSDALLGALAIIAPAASTAVQALDRDDMATYDSVMASTMPLARHVFGAPTPYYRTGIAFLSWLSGHQRGFTMVGGLQSARSTRHLVEAFRLADRAGLLPDPELAVSRMRELLAVAGFET